VSRRSGRRRGARLWPILALLLVVVALTLWQAGRAPGLEVIFLDVGQGDATLIRTADGRTALIDGGRSIGRLRDHLDSLAVTSFDLVIATHADFDHIAGLVAVLEDMPVTNFMDNGLPHTTQTYARLIDAIERSAVRYLESTERTLTLGDVTLTVLPPPLQSNDQNGNSVGVLLRYGDLEVVLPGDATAAEQAVWQQRYRDQLAAVDVYKAAHHGSSTGDRPEFVGLLSPEVVVVSAGFDNSYGHPHREAVASYGDVGATLYRTDLDGSVTLTVPPGGGSYRLVTGDLPAGGGWLAALEGLVLELLRGL
jgi:beta-lactamase superfamily II metal-dependent hydrolase